MKKILLIGTGGTIASIATKDGLTPSILPQELLSYVKCENVLVECKNLFNVDSTNIQPKNWYTLAECIKENYDNFDGFVITHGTDTLSYTACAISYLVQNPHKPIVLTGSQLPINVKNSDGVKNLEDSILFAQSGFNGVTVCFSGKIIGGVCSKKLKTVDFDGFESVNYPLIANIENGKILNFKQNTNNEPTKFYENLCENVSVVKLTPNMDKRILDFTASVSEAIVIEGYGSGGVPKQYMDEIEKIASKNIPIIISTQCVYEGTFLEKYEVGKCAKDSFNLFESGKMTIEHTLLKAMFCLSQKKDGVSFNQCFEEKYVKYY